MMKRSDKRKEVSGVEILFYLVVFILVILVISINTPNTNEYIRILENKNYTNIQLNGSAVFGCSDSDMYNKKFIATKNGKQIEGIICKGVTKGYTVRLF